MTSYERVKRAMHYQSVDKAPLRHCYSNVGYYEHGDKLNDLFATLPGDFQEVPRIVAKQPHPNDFDENGKYHALRKDEWGNTYEYRIFGIAGIAKDYPINSPEEAEEYVAPNPPSLEGPDFDSFASLVQTRKKNGFYTLMPWCKGLYERLIQIYGDENVLCDILMDEVGINKLADQIVEYDIVCMQRAIKAGCDCVFLADDYGSERSLLMSPDVWRRFFKPRLKKIFQPAVDAGLDIHFHSCGQISSILPDLRDVGVTGIWPQIPAFNMEELAAKCRDLGLAVEIHTDRARTMTYGTPEQVRELVKREFDTFKMMDGGSWFYIEVDNGFPYENIEALVETIKEYR